MIYLTIDQIRRIHQSALAQTGGLDGLRDPAALDAAANRSKATFDGADLYPTLSAKAAALALRWP